MSRLAGEIIFAVEKAPEGCYLVRALGHDIFTEADSQDGLRDAARNAVRCHFDENDHPKMVRFWFMRDRSLTAADAELSSVELAPTCFGEWTSEADTFGAAALLSLRSGDLSGDH